MESKPRNGKEWLWQDILYILPAATHILLASDEDAFLRAKMYDCQLRPYERQRSQWTVNKVTDLIFKMRSQGGFIRVDADRLAWLVQERPGVITEVVVELCTTEAATLMRDAYREQCEAAGKFRGASFHTATIDEEPPTPEPGRWTYEKTWQLLRDSDGLVLSCDWFRVRLKNGDTVSVHADACESKAVSLLMQVLNGETEV